MLTTTGMSRRPAASVRRGAAFFSDRRHGVAWWTYPHTVRATTTPKWPASTTDAVTAPSVVAKVWAAGSAADLRVGSEQVRVTQDSAMAYIIERNSQFYVVDYGGVDPHTNKERRRWYPAGRSREDAKAIAAQLTATRDGVRQRATSALTVGEYLVEQWLPRRCCEQWSSSAPVGSRRR
jgi:hypothetical protein